MNLLRRLRRILIGLSAASGCAGAWALGLGSPPPVLPLGLPLDVQVPVRLDEGEVLSSDCVRAEVRNGDSRLPAGILRVQVLSGPRGAAAVRLSSASIIDEPIVSVQVTAGCQFTVSREYVLFAEPMMAAAPAPALPLAGVEPLVPVAATAAAAAVSVVSEPAAAPAAPAVQAPPTAARPRADAQVRPAAPRPAVRSQAPVRRAADSRPRLRLEPTEPVREAPTAAAMREAFDAVARAASAAEAAASAASASQARVVELESSLARMTQDAKARDAELERLRKAVSEGQQRPFDASLVMSLLVSLLAALVLWLGWRLRSLRRQQEAAWAEAAAAMPSQQGPASLMPEVSRSIQPPVGTVTLSEAPRTTPGVLNPGAAALAPVFPEPAAPVPPRDVSGLDLLLEAEAAHAADAADSAVPTAERTQVLPPMEPDEVWPLRDVSIEELIDVDQQAEFFVALGQDSAAVDLLVAHLRDTGGGSPLTYLKLLEIYARQGDQAAYERLRERFNQRYHANAPEWGQDLAAGRGLQDYPDVLPRLERAWSRPLGAMAELEELLLRSSRGAPLDLPAYRDVLFLYSLARDRIDQEVPEGASDDVDLLLPLDDDSPMDLNLDLPGDASPRREDVPTSPVDLDLSLPSLDLGPPSSQGPLAEYLEPLSRPPQKPRS